MSWRDAPCTRAQQSGILRLIWHLPPSLVPAGEAMNQLHSDLNSGKFEATKGEASDIMERLHSISVYKRDKYSTSDVAKLFPRYFP